MPQRVGEPDQAPAKPAATSSDSQSRSISQTGILQQLPGQVERRPSGTRSRCTGSAACRTTRRVPQVPQPRVEPGRIDVDAELGVEEDLAAGVQDEDDQGDSPDVSSAHRVGPRRAGGPRCRRPAARLARSQRAGRPMLTGRRRGTSSGPPQDQQQVPGGDLAQPGDQEQRAAPARVVARSGRRPAATSDAPRTIRSTGPTCSGNRL